jgi:hypothetical protein
VGVHETSVGSPRSFRGGHETSARVPQNLRGQIRYLRLFQNFSFWNSYLEFSGKTGL